MRFIDGTPLENDLAVWMTGSGSVWFRAKRLGWAPLWWLVIVGYLLPIPTWIASGFITQGSIPGPRSIALGWIPTEPGSSPTAAFNVPIDDPDDEDSDDYSRVPIFGAVVILAGLASLLIPIAVLRSGIKRRGRNSKT